MPKNVYKRDGSPFYYATLAAPGGGTVRRSTGCTSQRQAVEAARKLQAELDLNASQTASANVLRFSEAAEIWVMKARAKRSHKETQLVLSKTVIRVLGDFDIAKFTTEDAMRFVQARRREKVVVGKQKTSRPITDATIRRGLSCISTVINFCVQNQEEGAPRTNPMKAFDRSFLKEAEPVDRHLRPQQFQALLDALANDEQRRILIILCGSGLRTGELTGLKWGEVDLEANIIEFGNQDPEMVKNVYSARRVPIMPPVRSALLAQLHAQGFTEPGKAGKAPPAAALVFPSRKQGKRRLNFGQFVRKVRVAAGLNNCRVHDLRHTYASWLLQKGVDPMAISSLLGHSTLSTTRRYARHVTDSVAAQIQKINLPIKHNQ